MRCLNNCFDEIIIPSNIWSAWLSYRKGKRQRPAVCIFERYLEENLLNLTADLQSGAYRHGRYYRFLVHDPKQRIISAPAVRDHIVHQAVCNIISPFYEKIFSPCSFSSRRGYGLHRAVRTLERYIRQVSRNYRRECWILHGDIEKCFDSINHEILFELLSTRINCARTLVLLKKIINSYNANRRYAGHDYILPRGIPLGNLTSQLFINIYLDSLDKHVKERLRVKRYLRYSDDFLIVSESRQTCEKLAEEIRSFLSGRLDLSFPVNHQNIRSLSRGISALGIRFLPRHQTIRPATFKRSRNLLKYRCCLYDEDRIDANQLNASWQSIRGLLQWGDNFRVKHNLLNALNKHI